MRFRACFLYDISQPEDALWFGANSFVFAFDAFPTAIDILHAVGTFASQQFFFWGFLFDCL
jgi:hypothetical protein